MGGGKGKKQESRGWRPEGAARGVEEREWGFGGWRWLLGGEGDWEPGRGGVVACGGGGGARVGGDERGEKWRLGGGERKVGGEEDGGMGVGAGGVEAGQLRMTDQGGRWQA